MITRSMQTSCGSLSTTRSSLSDRYRCVPPSFLEKLNNLGEERQAPIYVIYPNYALPDLGFVKTNASTDVIFSPFNYKMTMDGATGSTSSSGSLRKQRNSSQSVSEDEILKTLDYKHVADWQSLATGTGGEWATGGSTECLSGDQHLHHGGGQVKVQESAAHVPDAYIH